MQKAVKYLNDSFAYLKQNKKELAEMTLHYAITEKSNYSTQNELNRFKECLMNYSKAIDQNPILREWEFAKTLRQRIINSSNKNNSNTRKDQASKLREYMKEQKSPLEDLKSQIKNTYREVKKMSPYREIHFAYTSEKLNEIMTSDLTNEEKARGIEYVGVLAKIILEDCPYDGTGNKILKLAKDNLKKINRQNNLENLTKKQEEHLDLTPYEIIPLKIKDAKQQSQLEKTLSRIRNQKPTMNILNWHKNAINAFKSAKKDFSKLTLGKYIAGSSAYIGTIAGKAIKPIKSYLQNENKLEAENTNQELLKNTKQVAKKYFEFHKRIKKTKPMKRHVKTLVPILKTPLTPQHYLTL